MISKLDALLAARAELLAELDTEEASLRARLAEIAAARAQLVGGSGGGAARPRAPRVPRGSLEEQILAYLRERPGIHTPSEVEAALGISKKNAATALGQLVARGAALKHGRGVYEAARSATDAEDLEEPEGGEKRAASAREPEAPPRRETPADRLARVNAGRASAPTKKGRAA